MYEYIKGALISSTPSKAIVETQGIGFCILIPLNNFSKLPPLGSTVTLFTSFIVRQEAQRLFGFLTSHERDLFESLVEVSAIGPKTALCLIGHMEIGDLQVAISQGDIKLICKIPGIGKKTAERLIVEMRDKIKKGIDRSASSIQGPIGQQGTISDAISALIHLGYNSVQAQKAIQAALAQNQEEPELGRLITSALRMM